MQSFLPYPSFNRSAKVLDRARLGCQRKEAVQIFDALIYGVGNVNHPAVLMWKGSEGSLLMYALFMCQEWERRGYKNNISLQKIMVRLNVIGTKYSRKRFSTPWWLGKRRFHDSHKRTLLFKNYEWYSQFGWKVEPEYRYWWPTKEQPEMVPILT